MPAVELPPLELAPPLLPDALPLTEPVLLPDEPTVEMLVVETAVDVFPPDPPTAVELW